MEITIRSFGFLLIYMRPILLAQETVEDIPVFIEEEHHEGTIKSKISFALK